MSWATSWQSMLERRENKERDETKMIAAGTKSGRAASTAIYVSH